MFSCAHINRGSRDRKLGEETRDVGEQSLGRRETRSGGRGRELRNARVYYDIISLASHEALRR